MRLQRAFERVKPSDRSTADCPPPEQIWQAARGDQAPAEQEATLLHVAACPVCTEAWRLAQQLEEPVPEGAGLQVLGWRPVVLIAAAAVLALSLGDRLFLGGHVDKPESIYRSVDETDLELVSLPVLPPGRFDLRWRGPADATYSLRVSTAELPKTYLVEVTDLASPEYRVPEEVLEGVPDGAELIVRIEALDASGRLVQQGRFQAFLR
ncbi:MAG: hypothetical protein AAF657_37965 [Acidobacteriota bacterium]